MQTNKIWGSLPVHGLKVSIDAEYRPVYLLWLGIMNGVCKLAWISKHLASSAEVAKSMGLRKLGKWL